MSSSMKIVKVKSDTVWTGVTYDWGPVTFVPPKGPGVSGFSYSGNFNTEAGAVRSINRKWKSEQAGYKGNVLFVVYVAKFVGGPSDGKVDVSVDAYQGL
jgi:hypothetical protein